jgi:carbon-monoxide dehydrogenase medium subunit
MYAFDYRRPADLEEAAQACQGDSRYLAGGQSLVQAMKLRLSASEVLVDLGAVPGLAGITAEQGAIRVGAMARHADVARSALVRERLPALAELAEDIGDPMVRSMGTLGGSLANADPAACYPAAVLGLGATVHTDRRDIAADDFFVGLYTTALEAGEIITAVQFPIPQKAAYAKFRQPASRFALVGVFVAKTAGGARVAITGAGNGVFRHAGLEAALSRSFTPEAVEGVTVDAGELNADLHASAAYRAQLIKVQTQRAVRQAHG